LKTGKNDRNLIARKAVGKLSTALNRQYAQSIAWSKFVEAG